MAPPLDLKDLRNLSKRDPTGYHAEFLLQYRHFQTQLQIFLLKPSEDYKPFSELVEYLCHVSDIYTKDMPNFAEQISDLLEKNCDILASQLRRSLVSALILLRSKNQITPHSILSLFFKLFRCQDANLREMLYKHIVNDITNINKKHKNQSLNHALQNFMYTMMKDPSEMAAKQSLNVMIELYRKRVWNDAKTVNVISTGVFSKITSVVVASLKFFLTVAADDEEDRIAEAKEKAKLTVKKMNLKLGVKKMSHGQRERVEKTLHEAQQNRVPQRKLDPNWPAIELINDPQGYTEKVFGVIRHSFDRVEVKLMLMNFVSRLIFTHKLLVLNFYPFVQKYLMPKNEHVTYALSILAQCVHELIPPTDLQPVVKHLVDKFVHDKSSNESIVCGIHTLREMCNRNPLIMDEALLKDLAQYKNYKDKAVQTAARGLISVFRVHNPALLERSDRGKVGNMNKEKPKEYGQVTVNSGVEDIELLEAIERMEQEKRTNKRASKVSVVDSEGNVITVEDEDEDDDGEEGESDEEGDGWMEVDGDSDEFEEEDVDDSEEEVVEEIVKPAKKPKGGVVPVVGVMSIAEALKLEQMNREAIQRAQQKRKRGQQFEEEEEDNEEDEDEDEDEEDDDDEESDELDELEEEEEKEPEIDIWEQIEMADQIPQNGTVTKKAATPPSKPLVTPKPTATHNGSSPKATLVKNGKQAKVVQPPTKKTKLSVVPVESESEDEVESDSDDEGEFLSEDETEWEEVIEGKGDIGDSDSDESDGSMEEEVEEEEEEEEPQPKKLKPNSSKTASQNPPTKKKQQAKQVAVKQPAANAEMEVTSEQKQDDPNTPKLRIDHTRLLTAEDFEKLNRLKEMKAAGKINFNQLTRMANKAEESSESEDEGNGLVDPSDLTRGIKTPRKKGDEKMAEILERRKANKEINHHKEKLKLTTNAENTKRKNIIMIVKGKKSYAKSKMSFKDQQIAKQKGKEKFKKRKHR